MSAVRSSFVFAAAFLAVMVVFVGVQPPGTMFSSGEQADAAEQSETTSRSIRTASSPSTPDLGSAASNAVSTAGATCASCHAGIVQAYRATNHAKSLTLFDPATAPETFEDATVCNEASNLCYEAFVKNGDLRQREFRTDADGNRVHVRTHTASHVIGSGNATRSYLMNVNGFLTEMPLTWYVERERWDMSPGYEDANDRFRRQINLECASCHTAAPTKTPFTQNHYTDIPTGISCESCHGASDAHVAFHQNGASGGETDPMVRLANLDRERQLSTCQQCHLAGITVFEPGEDPTTFEPGQALADNRTVYVPDKQLTDPDWVGIDSHPIRLARSACFDMSEMTCTTCHDPHRPADAMTDADYNVTCQSCHEQPAEQTLCSRTEATTPDVATSGNCVSCHLQSGGTSDVPHVTFTDHWIRKDPGPPRDPDDGRPSFDSPTPLELVPLRTMTRLRGPAGQAIADGAERAREAIAYFHFYETMHRHPAYVTRTVERGAQATEKTQAEVAIARARALSEQGAPAEALRVLQTAAATHPDDAWVHYWRAAMAVATGQLGEAETALDAALRIQPKLVEAQLLRSNVYLRTNRLAQAQQQLETLVELDPVHTPRAWFNLGLVRLQRKDVRGARDAFETASDLDPDLIDAHVQLARIYFQVELYDRAETHLGDALAAAPDNAKVHGMLGILHAQTGDAATARHHLQRVLEIDPQNRAARTLLQQLGS